MKIMLVCRVYPWHRPGGMPFVTQDRAQALAALGHEVTVFTTPFELAPASSEPMAERGFRASPDGDVRIAWQEHVPHQHWSAAFAESCEKFASAFNPDIIHSDSFDNNHPWITEWTGRCHTAITLHGFTAGSFITETTRYRLGLRDDPPVFDSTGNLREARALAGVRRVITVSRHEHRLAEQFYGIEPDVLLNPIPDYFFTPTKPIPEKAYAFCAGVSGTSGNRRFDLAEQVCREIGLPIRVVSHVPRVEMPALYDGCLCYLLPTLWSTGFDGTVAEANARGRIVIASRVGSYAEHEYDSGISMLTFRPDDVARFRELVVDQMESRRTADVRLSLHRGKTHAINWIESILGGV